MAKGDDIEERMITFAVQIVNLCSNMPKTQAGSHIAGQLLRSGTAPAAHYAEARGAESAKDFIHKLRLCVKELNESRVWLRIMQRSGLSKGDSFSDVFRECDEVCRIISASIKTTRTRNTNIQNKAFTIHN